MYRGNQTKSTFSKTNPILQNKKKLPTKQNYTKPKQFLLNQTMFYQIEFEVQQNSLILCVYIYIYIYTISICYTKSSRETLVSDL